MHTKAKWVEPVEFTRAFAQTAGLVPSHKRRLVGGIIVAAAIILITRGFELFFLMLHKKDLGVPGYFYFVAPAIAGIFVYYLPAMLLSISAKIVLSEDGLYRIKAIGTEVTEQHWPWDIIESLAIEDVRYGSTTHRALVVRVKDASEEALIGLGDASVDEIAELARFARKPLEIRKQ